MNKDTMMTEWLNLERLESNSLPLPQYETEFSAGVDFAACLTRPCKHIPPGKTHKQAEQFICCEPTLACSYNGYPAVNSGNELDAPTTNKIKYLTRHRVSDDYQGIQQTDIPTLAIMPNETIMIPLGFKAEFGNSYVLTIHVRSSLGLSGLILANGTGIVDPDYRGELFTAVHNRNNHEPIVIEHGQRIIQGVLIRHNQAVITECEVGKTKRGSGGFGSTGESADGRWTTQEIGIDMVDPEDTTISSQAEIKPEEKECCGGSCNEPTIESSAEAKAKHPQKR